MRSRLELTEPTDGFVFDLVSLEALKLELGLADSDDAANTARITRESKLIAETCDRVFGFSAATEIFQFESGDVTRYGQALSLSLFPVDAVDLVTIDDVGLAESDYSLDTINGRIWRPNASWSGTVVVEYSGGYDLPDGAPGGLQRACIEAVRARLLSLSRDPSIRETSDDGSSVGYFSEGATAGALSASVIELLRPYRRLSV